MTFKVDVTAHPVCMHGDREKNNRFITAINSFGNILYVQYSVKVPLQL